MQKSDNWLIFLMKKKIFLLLFFVFCCVGMTGCVYSTFEIHDVLTSPPQNDYNEKYYVNSIKGLFITPQQESDIKTALPQQYPDIFVSDPSKGRTVDFYWTIEYNRSGFSTAFLAGLTLGLVPCISWETHSGSITAKLKEEECGYFTHSSFSNRTYPYIVKEKTFLHTFPILSHLVDGFWSLFITADTTTSFNAGVHEQLSAPHNSCAANLRLFLRACNLMMANVRTKELKQQTAHNTSLPSRKSVRQVTSTPSAAKKETSKSSNKFTLPVPPKMTAVASLPKSALLGKWKCRAVSKTKLEIKSIKHEQITTMGMEYEYNFMDNGKVLIEISSNSPRASKTKSLSDYHYNGQAVTIKSKTAKGGIDIVQYKIIWYADNKMALRILDTKAHEKRLLVGDIKKASYSIAENGIQTTVLNFETQNEGKNQNFR